MKRSVVLSAFALGALALTGLASAHEGDRGGYPHGDGGYRHGGWYGEHSRGYWYDRPVRRDYVYRPYPVYRGYYAPGYAYYPDVYVAPVAPGVALVPGGGLSVYVPLR